MNWWATGVLEELGREASQPTVIVVETAVDDLELPQCDRRWAIEFVLNGWDLYR